MRQRINDSTEAIFRSNAEQLAGVFALCDATQPSWREEELGTILNHQLAAPIEFDLALLDPGIQRLLRAAAEGDSVRTTVRTFNDLLNHPSPPLPLLKLAKDFAKSHLRHPESPLPKPIATVLYYASIAVALDRLSRRISSLTKSDLKQGLDQALNQRWLNTGLRTLFLSVRKQIDTDSSFIASHKPDLGLAR